MQTIIFICMCLVNLVSCVINDCPKYDKPKQSQGKDLANSFLTFNANLLWAHGRQKERFAQLPAALLEEDADVICLNEVFSQDHISKIVKDVKQVYPNVYSSIHDGTTNNLLTASSSPCPFSWSSIVILNCIQRKCGDKTTVKDLIQCDIEKECNAWKKLSQECIICTGTTGLAQASSCFLRRSKVNVAGNMILSKTPITKAESTLFVTDKQVNRYGKLIVEIAGRTIACTKLQTALDGPYYEPDTMELFSSSWAVENLSQAKCILSNFQQQDKVILMGNLECGPAIPSKDIRKEHELSYNNLTIQFDSPYVSDVGLQTSRKAKIITTHVMQKGYSGQHTCSRVLDRYNGEELSKQYGVKCTIPY